MGCWCRLFEELSKLQTLGVTLPSCSGSTCCYTLRYGGEVPQDGNCLFEALALALGGLETGAQVCMDDPSPSMLHTHSSAFALHQQGALAGD